MMYRCVVENDMVAVRIRWLTIGKINMNCFFKEIKKSKGIACTINCVEVYFSPFAYVLVLGKLLVIVLLRLTEYLLIWDLFRAIGYFMYLQKSCKELNIYLKLTVPHKGYENRRSFNIGLSIAKCITTGKV